MFQLDELCVNYQKGHIRPALEGVTMSLNSEKAVIVGPNGSGKTTLIKTLLGLVQASSGRIRVFGKDPREISGEVRVSTNLIDVYRIMRLSISDLIRMYSEMKGFEPDGPLEMIQSFGLGEILGKKIHETSSGEQKMVSNILALSFSPQLILLDEPFDNVDLPRRLKFSGILNSIDSEILLNTHEFDVLPRLGDWSLYFMIEGRLFGKFRTSQLKDLYINRGNVEGSLSIMETSFGTFSVTEHDGQVPITGAGNLTALLGQVA